MNLDTVNPESEPQQELRLSARLQILALDCETHHLSLEFLLTKLGVSSHALVIFIFSVPFLLPIPVPGLSMILGSFIALSGFYIAIRKPIWLPQAIANKKIDGVFIAKIFSTASRLLQKVEFLFKPRLADISERPVVRGFVGFLIFVSGILLLLPLPPGTNFPPALVCALLSLGLLERDGLLLLIGFGVFILKIILIFNLLLFFFQT